MYNYLEYFLAALFIVLGVLLVWFLVKYEKNQKIINNHFLISLFTIFFNLNFNYSKRI